jgi:parvulin-like peptidyl-prolyl isomerase
LKRIIKEPLLAFLVLGGLIFVVFQQVSDDASPDTAEIVITKGQIKALSIGFEKVWQRSPTETETKDLVQNHVREEILYREALAMGLDRGDGIIKRRLRQKMEFLSEDIANLIEPDDSELQSYLDKHRQDYRQPTRYSFRQIFFDAGKRGQAANDDAGALLKTLSENGTDITELGDRLMIRQSFENETESEIKNTMGSDFLNSLQQLPTGNWSGPIRSGFGLHLVYIDQRIEGSAPQLDKVRNLILRDWALDKRKQINETFYETMRKRYEVKSESPDGSTVNYTETPKTAK